MLLNWGNAAKGSDESSWLLKPSVSLSKHMSHGVDIFRDVRLYLFHDSELNWGNAAKGCDESSWLLKPLVSMSKHPSHEVHVFCHVRLYLFHDSN
jgi:hypothetical protein